MKNNISQKIKLFFISRGLRFCMGMYLCVVKLVTKKRTHDAKSSRGIVLLLTGRFYSDNWIMSHLRPLSEAEGLEKIILVSTYKIPDIANVEVIYPSGRLVRIIGATPARLLTFIKIGYQRKPQLIGGFHLLLNGLVALLLARSIGARSLYNCGGGIREVAGGGYATETKLFKLLGRADYKIESQLLQAVSYFDAVVVRGRGAVTYFSQYTQHNKIHIVTGGIDGNRFFPGTSNRTIDLVLTGRISEVKRLDIFIQAIQCVSGRYPDISAVIIGDGPLKKRMESLSVELGVADNIKFIGHQSNVEYWLQRSKIFVLTSASEGLSLALIEAMLSGLPAVVSDVGDLADLVEHGVNGYTVKELNPEEFAKYFGLLLSNKEGRIKMGIRARAAAERCELKNVSKLWGNIFENLNN